jgi:hypothetical protein
MIAVEVRRLDKAVETPGGLRVIGGDSTPLMFGIRKLLDEIRLPGECGRWLVHVFLSPHHRASWRTVKPLVRQTIQRFLADPRASPHEYDVTPSLRLRFIPSTRPTERTFEFFGLSDSRASGFVTPDLHDNLRRCIAEKASKIAKVRERYGVWWLVLVDRLHGCVPDDFSADEFGRAVGGTHPFERITLVSGWGDDWSFDLWGPQAGTFAFQK